MPRRPARGPRRAAVAAVVAVLLAACTAAPGQPPPAAQAPTADAPPVATAGTTPEPTAGGTGAGGPASTPPAAAEQPVTIAIAEPAHLLAPRVADQAGRQVHAALWTGLVTTDPRTGAPTEGIAESITTDDNLTFAITVAPGWTFHDGTPVTARTFVDTFTWATAPTTADVDVGAYRDIAGIDPATGRHDGEGLDGVALVDERTFTVTLVGPRAHFPLRLASPAMSPLPPSCLADPDGCDARPIGTGPYRVDGSWQPGTGLQLVRWDDHPAADPEAPARIELRSVPTPDEALAQVEAGAVDIAAAVPGPQIAAVAARAGDALVRRPVGSVELLALPVLAPEHAGEDGRALRRALSLAIDRDRLVAEVVPQWLPADALLPPTVPGHRPGTCTACRHDPEAARALWDAAGGLAELTVLVNAGAGHEAWAQAVVDGWVEVFDLAPEQVAVEAVPFAAYVGEVLGPRAAEGPFRLGWALDSRSPAAILRPLFASDGTANYAGYASAEVDALLARADATPGTTASSLAYGQVEAAVLADLPVIPLFVHQAAAVHGPRVAGVALDADGLVQVQQLRVQP